MVGDPGVGLLDLLPQQALDVVLVGVGVVGALFGVEFLDALLAVDLGEAALEYHPTI